jgi:hypothetical protein
MTKLTSANSEYDIIIHNIACAATVVDLNSNNKKIKSNAQTTDILPVVKETYIKYIKILRSKPEDIVHIQSLQ